MISYQPSLAEILVSSGLVILGIAIWLGRWLNRNKDRYPTEEERPWPVLSLNDPFVRERMRFLLETHHIRGNCDIRDGEVHVAVMPGERSAMAYALMRVYNRAVEDTGNKNLEIFYLKQGALVPTNLQLDSLREIAEMLEKHRI